MQDTRFFKIDTLIRLAKLTTDTVKRQQYLDEVENILFEIDTVPQKNGGASVIFDQAQDTANDFLSVIEGENILMCPLADLYERYCSHCRLSEEPPLTKWMFGRLLKNAGYVSGTRKALDARGQRVSAKVIIKLPGKEKTPNVPNENN